MNQIFDPVTFNASLFKHGNSKFIFDGRLFVRDDKAWLEVGCVETVIIPIVDHGFVDRILEVVPCLVGGEYLYDDSVLLNGDLDFRDGNFSIISIESGTLNRDDEGEFVF